MLSPAVKQTWVSLGILINMIGMGIMLSYPSSLQPGLERPDSPIKVDLDTASWLSSCVGLASPPGFFMSACLMEWRGRKFAQLVALIPSIIGWTLIYFANDVPTILVGRILTGITGGATVTLGAIIMGEYSSPKYRGTFLGLKTATVCLGGMVCHILGYYFQWKTVAILSMIPQVISFAIVCTWPESPCWLIAKNRFEDCTDAFYSLRGKNEESRRELAEMFRAQKERMAEVTKKQSILDSTIVFFKKFTRKDFIKPTLIMVATTVIIEASGRHVFPAYSTNIVGGIIGDKTASFVYIICLDIITTASAAVSSYLVQIMKRRTLLLTSGFSGLVVLFIACLYLYLMSIGTIPKEPTWPPIALFVVFFILVNLGCTPIPLAIIGEIYPLVHRGAGTVVSGVAMSLTLMAALKITPGLLVSIQIYGTFAVFGCGLLIALLVIYYMLPETKDRTLQEIEDYFVHGRFIENVADGSDVKMINEDPIKYP